MTRNNSSPFPSHRQPERRPGTTSDEESVVTTSPSGDVWPARLAYSIDEVAQITGLSRDLLYAQMRTGRLRYLKVGRRRIITRQHLDAFLAQDPA